MVLSVFLFGCAPSSEVSTQPKSAVEEVRVIEPQNFTLVGFWKIEKKFIVDEEKSTENTTEWVEVPVPKEKYKEFKEYGQNCAQKNETEFLNSFIDPSDPGGLRYDANGMRVKPATIRSDGGVVRSVGDKDISYPPLTIVPSPTFPSGIVPGGVCYLHEVHLEPEFMSRALYVPSLLVMFMLGNITQIGIQEFTHQYNFSADRLEMITNNLGDVEAFGLKKTRTILTPSTQAAAEADGWPYENATG